MEDGIPVHQALTSVDQAFLVQTDKDFGDGLGQAFVHGKALTGPIGGGTQAAQLLSDGATGAFFPLPNTFDKGVTA